MPANKPSHPPRHRVETLSREQLLQLLEKHPDTSLSRMPGSRIRYLQLEDVYSNHPFGLDKDCVPYYHVILDDRRRRLLGCAAMQTNPYNKSMVWCQSVSVDPEHRNRGMGRALVGAMLAKAASDRQLLELSRLSYFGRKFLLPLVEQEAKRFSSLKWCSSGMPDMAISSKDIEEARRMKYWDPALEAASRSEPSLSP